MTERMSDRFTNGAVPPFDAPQGVLAWIELPTGNVYLQPNYQWMDYEDAGRGRILNNCLKVLDPGPAYGFKVDYFSDFVSAFYDNRYPVFRRIIEDLGGPQTVY